MKFHRSVLVLLVILVSGFEVESSSSNKQEEEVKGCRHRDYGNGATVCVCTEDYCDNLGHVDLDSVPSGSIATFVTSKDGDRFRKETIKPEQNNLITPEVSIKIDRQKRFQKIVGFGGSFTDSAGFNINKLEPKLAERLIRDYYGQDGIEYSMGRIPIGGSDFSIRPYTYDDNAGDEDLELDHFELQWEDLQFKIPYLNLASNVSQHSVKFFASTWSPPAWMKENQQLTNGSNLIGQPGGKYYQVYAKYLVRFLDEYNQNNVSLWGLTMQNEPVTNSIPNNPTISMEFEATLQRDFLKQDLGPELERTGYSKLNVILYDDGLNNIEEYVDTVLSDPEASQYTSGIAFHWYFNQNYSDREPLESIRNKYSDRYFLLSSEACRMLIDIPTAKTRITIGKAKPLPLGDWDVVDYYADDIIKDLNHWTGGWVDWNLALDPQGGPNWIRNYVDAAVIVNCTGTEYYKQPYFYALGHFSKFLPPESIRLGQTIEFGETITNHSSIMATTFLRPDNRTVMTVLNTNQKNVTIRVQDNGLSIQDSFQFTLKPNSLSSLIWY